MLDPPLEICCLYHEHRSVGGACRAAVANAGFISPAASPQGPGGLSSSQEVSCRTPLVEGWTDSSCTYIFRIHTLLFR